VRWQTASDRVRWSGEIVNREAKQRVARRLAERLRDGDTVGVGSGSTSFLALQELVARAGRERLSFTAIPTSLEVSFACEAFGVPTTSLRRARPDWSFDGADEVDPAHRMIKGRGGALFTEKILMASSPEVYIVIDPSKRVERLGSRHPVPVEVDPDALSLLDARLGQLGCVTGASLRVGTGKDGPVITERGNLLYDVAVSQVPESLERDLELIPGVVEVGLFTGFAINLLVAEDPG
jgi:ribose 5-phosphate isomerase A